MKHRLPVVVESHLQEQLADHDFQGQLLFPPMHKVQMAMNRAFEATNKEINVMGTDVRYSGSTCCSILVYGNHLYMANVGDSRAIIVSQDPDHPRRCFARALTRDHKPDDPDELKVIVAAGGRVDSYRDAFGKKVGPERVWMKDADVPGLAMSRSFGDQVASSVGVNSVPEITELRMNFNDKVVVLASDGVWEFLGNEQVANIVYPYFLQRNAEGAAENLVRMAYKQWKK